MNHFLNFPASLSDPRGWYWSRLVLGWYLLVLEWSSSGWYGNEFGGIASWGSGGAGLVLGSAG
jgi:hypothetical protein